MRVYSYRSVLVAVLIAAVLGLGMLGYLSPQLRAHWETFMSFCGF